MQVTESKLDLPAFLTNLAQAYYAKLARCIVLAGNIHDLFPLEKEGEIHFVPLEQLLEETFQQRVSYPTRGIQERFAVITIKSDGFHFVSQKDRNELFALCGELCSPTRYEEFLKDEEKAKRAKDLGENLMSVLGELDKIKIPTTTLKIVQLIKRLLQEASKVRRFLNDANIDLYIRPLCIIFDQADALFPNVEIGRMMHDDRESWKSFSDLIRDEDIWADAGSADQRPDLIILLSPTAAELNSKIFALPKVELVHVSLPDDAALHAFITLRLEQFPIANLYEGTDDPVSNLVNDARGLAIRTLDDLITAASRDPDGSPLTRKAITQEVNRQLMIELGETVKFVRPLHSMDDVVGFSMLKPRLRRLARWIDDPESAPAGMVVVGPNGAGKTFIIEAWAAGIGRVVLTIAGGMKSKWYGETEVFLEKFEEAVARYGRVCVIIDEADDMLKALHDADAHETDKQFVRHLVQMIGNPKYRSKIFWVLITTRPDLLPPDFVRSGRCSLFVPIVDPFEAKDVENFFDWMMTRFERKGIVLSDEEKVLLREKIRKPGEEFAAGDYRKFIDDFINSNDYFMNELKQPFVVIDFIASWRPNAVRIGLERRLQTLLLALYCGEWPELIPPQYREKNETELRQEIEEVKLELRLK